jgi:hypothetical protein
MESEVMIKRLTLLVVVLLASIPVMVSLPNQVFAESVDTAWVRRYDGPVNLDDYPAAITVDGSGNAYVTGYSKGSGTDWDYTTIKYFPNGDTGWVRRYNGPGNGGDDACDIAGDDSGYAYVTGTSYGSGANYDCATVKYKPNGDIAWVERYNGPGNLDDVANAIAVDDSRNVYVTGNSKVSETDWDYVTIKYYPDGDTVWVRRYNGPGNSFDNASAIAVDDSGYVYVTGYSQGSGTLYDYATIKYTPDGDTVWVRRYNGPDSSWDYANAIAVDGSKNVYVSGYSYDNETSDDYTVIKYYPNGDTAWVRRYNGLYNSADNAKAMVLDHSDNVYVTGTSVTGDDNSDYATVKYNSEGDSLWVGLYDGPGNSDDGARAIAVDDSNNVYVTGESDGSGTYQDYATIKYFRMVTLLG